MSAEPLKVVVTAMLGRRTAEGPVVPLVRVVANGPVLLSPASVDQLVEQLQATKAEALEHAASNTAQLAAAKPEGRA